MEKDLQKKCVDYIRSQGLMVYSNNPPSYKRMTYGTLNQLPDLTIVNFNAYIELKDHKYTKAHKTRQEKQAKRRKELTKAGARAYKCDTFEKVVRIINFLVTKYTSVPNNK